MKKLNLITILLAVFILLMGCKKECAFVYSGWTSCSNNIQTRTYTSSPSGCTGTPPADSLQRSCVILPSIPTVIIGTQTWTTKNLDVATYRNGDTIPQLQDSIAWGLLTTKGAWCYYNNDPANGTTYGKLYNWYAVNDPRGLAPTGYHIPSDAEWSTLTTYLGGTTLAGGKMKEASTLYWLSPNMGATNSSGFTGLPGGNRTTPYGFFMGRRQNGIWWSSSEGSAPGKFMARGLVNSISNVTGFSSIGESPSNGFSVRCIKD